MLSAGGDPPGRMAGGRIPSATEWADPNVVIPGYGVVPVPYRPQRRDVIAQGEHVGIYLELPDGSPGTVSAASPGNGNGVVHNDWGLRSGQAYPTVRRCDCDL